MLQPRRGLTRSIQRIADSLDYSSSLKLDDLKSSISHLVTASTDLDAKAHSALKKLHSMLPKPPKRPSLWSRLKEYFHPHKATGIPLFSDTDSTARTTHAGTWGRMTMPNDNAKKVGELLKVLRGVNKKRAEFESGFISEEGLKDRAWYRHKGTAPGLWLGYGATTFPALTEGESGSVVS